MTVLLEMDFPKEDMEGVEAMEYPSAGFQEFDMKESLSATQLKLKKKLEKKKKSGGFETLGLSLPVFRAVKRKGYRIPTPIQRKTLPLILAGYDVVAMARTGSGKTAAFLIPMIEKLVEHSNNAGARAVILSPSRELALQTFKFCKELSKYTDLKIAILVGGDSMEAQFEQLAGNPDVIIATPGRLMHHLSEVEGMSLRTVEYIVFDEADRLFEMGFAEQLRQIMSHLGESRQVLLFSATLPRLLADFAKAGLRDPHLVRLDVESRISPDLQLSFFTVRHDEKPAALVHLVREVIPAEQQTIVFVATKHHVEFLYELLKTEGIDISVVYGSMDQAARKIHIAKFRAGKTKLLLVTDVAARGIDIPLLDNVINYDFPPKPKLFVHRVGRAARAGRTGTSYSFVTSEEMPYVLDLHLYLSKGIRPAPLEEAIVADREKVMADLEAASKRGETIFGRMPQSVLDFGMDRLREVISNNDDLIGLQKAAKNAYKLYVKTRPPAALESAKRAKGFAREGLHPSLRQQLRNVEAEVAAFTERLKAIRPRQTVLEAEAEAAKGKNKNVPIAQVVEIMKRKREVHEHVIAAAAQQRAAAKAFEKSREDTTEATAEEQPTMKRRRKGAKDTSDVKQKLIPKSYRDEEFFIEAVPRNRHMEAGLSVQGGDGFGRSRMDTEVLDLIADDAAGVQKQNATYHWDKKNKKFVKLNKGEQVTASGKIKTESGSKVNAGNHGLYKKWKERSHMHVPTHGEADDAPGALDGAPTSSRGGRGGRGGRGSSRGDSRGSLPNANVKNELRGVEEVRKERQKKAMRSARGGGKGGRGGGGGSGRGGGRGGSGGGRGRRGSSRGGRGGGRGGRGRK